MDDWANDLQISIKDINNSQSYVTIKFDTDFFSAGRDAPYKNLPYKFAPALQKVGDYVRTVMIPRTFEQEGPGWSQLAKRTQAERQIKGYNPHHPILRRTNDLFKELTDKSHPKHIEVVKTGKYARIELGGSSVKFIQNQLGQGDPGQRLPSRPMIPGTGGLPLQERDRQQIKKILLNAIKGPA